MSMMEEQSRPGDNLQGGSPLAATIHSIRRGLKMTRKQLAGVLGCPANAVTVWEIGRHTPSTPRLIKLLFLAQTSDEKAAINEALKQAGISPACLTSPDTLQSFTAHDSTMSQAT